jgi:hypothetical protein
MPPPNVFGGLTMPMRASTLPPAIADAGAPIIIGDTPGPRSTGIDVARIGPGGGAPAPNSDGAPPNGDAAGGACDGMSLPAPPPCAPRNAAKSDLPGPSGPLGNVA